MICNNTNATRKITARTSQFEAQWSQKPYLMFHNILDANMRIKIGDFGLAAQLEYDGEMRRT